jgi:hypothetical protein
MNMRHFIIRSALLALMALVFGTTPAAIDAQDDDAMWYFAANPDTGEVVAFIYAGNGAIDIQMSAVLDDGVTVQYGWRIDSQTILLHAGGADGVVRLFVIGPDGIAPIAMPPELTDSELDDPDTYSYPYYVYQVNVDTDSRTANSLLVNVEALAADILPPEQDDNIKPRLSENGRYLRYVALDDKSGAWLLYDLDLSLGIVRAVGEIPSYEPVGPLALPDRYGERWMISADDPDDYAIIYQTLSVDGTVTELGRFTEETPFWIWMLDDYVSYRDEFCFSDCLLELRPLEGGEPIFYPLPEGYSFLVYEVLPGGQIIGEVSSGASEMFYMLRPDTPPLELGTIRRETGWLEYDHLSPDERWLLAWVEDEDSTITAYRLWDLSRETLVTEQPYADPALAGRYGDGGFVAQRAVDDGIDAFALRYSDSMTWEWFHATNADIAYFDVLPDGTLLYRQTGPEQPGLYHYSPATGAETLLLDGALPVDVQRLNPR